MNSLRNCVDNLDDQVKKYSSCKQDSSYFAFLICHFLSLVNRLCHVLLNQLFLSAEYVKIGHIVIKKHFFKKFSSSNFPTQETHAVNQGHYPPALFCSVPEHALITLRYAHPKGITKNVNTAL